MLSYVTCPICGEIKATGGNNTFRCCKHEFLIKEHKTDWNDAIARKPEQKKQEIEKYICPTCKEPILKNSLKCEKCGEVFNYVSTNTGAKTGTENTTGETAGE